MGYLVFCTFDIEEMSVSQAYSRAMYEEVYDALETISLFKEYRRPGKGISLGLDTGLAGPGLMRGGGTTNLTAPIVEEFGRLPSTTVVGRVPAASPMEAVAKVRRDVEGIFRWKGLKGRAFVVAATNEECDSFLF